jgi:hypothetical protein
VRVEVAVVGKRGLSFPENSRARNRSLEEKRRVSIESLRDRGVTAADLLS